MGDRRLFLRQGKEKFGGCFHVTSQATLCGASAQARTHHIHQRVEKPSIAVVEFKQHLVGITCRCQCTKSG